MQLQNPELAYETKKISLYTRTWQRCPPLSTNRDIGLTPSRAHTHAGTYNDKFIVVLYSRAKPSRPATPVITLAPAVYALLASAVEVALSVPLIPSCKRRSDAVIISGLVHV